MNRMHLLQKLGGVIGVIALVTLAGWLRGAVTPALEVATSPGWADLESADASPTASLLGELRGGFADYLWLKADRLVHNGVELRALTEGEKRAQRRWKSSQAHGEETPVARCEDGATTVIPNAEADHRGILGRLEREVKPFMDMRSHHHRDPGETAALFRLMTWVNPRFIPGWVVGANVLAGNLKRPKEALAFLQEAEAKNPESLEIQTELGRYLLYTFHDARAAERHFRRAIDLGARHARLPADELDAWVNAHRWLVIEYGRLGRAREAREVAEAAIRRFPEDSGYFRHALTRPELQEDRPS
jgi:tetratricopeptide (TPR) repeat protein